MPAKTTTETDGERAGRTVRIAAVGDLHFDPGVRGGLMELFASAAEEADVLVLCGDMTTHGRAEQARGFVDELRGLDIPIVAVLGNHDCESGEEEEVSRVLCDAGIHLLNGEAVVLEGVGFAGTKGFAGGFGRGMLAPFGERLIKEFVQEAIDESLKLENALRALDTDTKVVVLHYAPIVDTLKGEPEAIYPFLGSSRLLQPIDTMRPDLVLHGHAHHGSFRGETPGGVPVINVSLPVLKEQDRDYFIWEAGAPERRRREDDAAVEEEVGAER